MPYSPKTWTLDDPITPTDLNRIEDGIDEVTDLVDSISLDDNTVWRTVGITAATGWSVSYQRYRRYHQVLYLYVSFQRTGADITIGANGDLGNTTIGTLPAGYRPLQANQVVASGGGGRVATGAIDADGSIVLAAVAPGSDIVTNNLISLGGAILLL